jgi:tRNA-2-methylthio-N6-dimethylallyladenosine synthase
MTRKFHVVTFGCQMNDFDSQRIRGLLASRGFEAEDDPARADLIVLNTCSIRDKAEHKVYSQIGVFRKYKRERPEVLIGVAGCMAQEHGEDLLRQVPEIDLVVGPQNVFRLPGLVRELTEARARGSAGARRVAVEERELVQPIEHDTVARSSPVKAYVTVMEGCDYLCSFCIVPYVRGREKCRAPEDIEAEVRWLCERGWREVVLLGQTVNKYRHGETSFAGLLRRLDRTPGLARLRFTSPHPVDFTPELIQTMAGLESVCEHVHVPVQSGSSRILKKMRRRYTRGEYLDRIGLIRGHMPEAAISTDIIVGFPGETEDEMQETLSLIEEVRYDHVFAFCYNERPGTGAAHMHDDVPEEVKRRRLNELFALQLPIGRSRNERLLGTVHEVLVEGPSGREAGQLTGRTRTNKAVNFHAPDALVGDLLEVRLTEATAHSFRAEPVRLVDRPQVAPASTSLPELVQIL